MKTQVNSDQSITVSASLVRFVSAEVDRALDRFAAKLTRVEVHLSDVNSKKAGEADKRCMVEARPAGSRPISVTATAATVEAALAGALGKMRRSLTTVFGRLGRTVGRAPSGAKSVPPTRAGAAKSALERPAAARATAPTSAAKTTAAAKKAAGAKATATDSRGPKKKSIFQARRKSWPAR